MLRVPASPVRGASYTICAKGRSHSRGARSGGCGGDWAGAGGGVIAKELACAGMRVVLLERDAG